MAHEAAKHELKKTQKSEYLTLHSDTKSGISAKLLSPTVHMWRVTMQSALKPFHSEHELTFKVSVIGSFSCHTCQ